MSVNEKKREVAAASQFAIAAIRADGTKFYYTVRQLKVTFYRKFRANMENLSKSGVIKNV